MYINFYGDKINYAISIPIYIYKIKAYIKGKGTDTDILGETIINLLEEGDTLNIDYLSNVIGIPSKYRKLVEYEVNELLDNNKICIDENKKVTSKTNEEKISEKFYVLYDNENNVFLDCIIPEHEFEKRYLRKERFNKDKSYILNNKLKKPNTNRYEICSKVQQLINRSNELYKLKYEKELNNREIYDIYTDSEDEIFLSPFYEISLETIENIEGPNKADFLIKAYVDQYQNLILEDPFSGEDSSKYIETYIKKNIDYDKIINILNNSSEFIYIDKLKERALEYINLYKKLDKNSERLMYIEKIAFYKEMLSVDGDLYKNFSLATTDIEKVVKSLLKEVVDKFVESKFLLKNINIMGLGIKNELDSIEDIKIIDVIKNKNYKVIHSDKKVINSIGETSISSYLSCIYISKFFTRNEFEEKVFKIFTSDFKMVNFINKVWLYRNNTSHNIEKYKYYDSEYDMDIMQKERLLEVNEELIDDLIYFVKKIKSL